MFQQWYHQVLCNPRNNGVRFFAEHRYSFMRKDVCVTNDVLRHVMYVPVQVDKNARGIS